MTLHHRRRNSHRSPCAFPPRKTHPITQSPNLSSIPPHISSIKPASPIPSSSIQASLPPSLTALAHAPFGGWKSLTPRAASSPLPQAKSPRQTLSVRLPLQTRQSGTPAPSGAGEVKEGPCRPRPREGGEVILDAAREGSDSNVSV